MYSGIDFSQRGYFSEKWRERETYCRSPGGVFEPHNLSPSLISTRQLRQMEIHRSDVLKKYI